MESLPVLHDKGEIGAGAARLALQPVLPAQPQAPGAPFHLPPLQVGEGVTLWVTEQLAPHRFLVAVKGTLLEVTAPADLPVGSAFTAQVAQLKPEVVLQILDQEQSLEAEAARILRTHIPHRASVSQSLDALRQELAHLAERHGQDEPLPGLGKLQALMTSLLSDETSVSAERLATFVRDGGLHYEAKLVQLAQEHPQALARVVDGDLKGLLLRALKDLEASSVRSEAPSLAASIANHLDHIETQQVLNVLSQIHGEPYQLQVPFISSQGLSTVLLSIDPEGDGGKHKRGGHGQGYRVFVLLDLKGLGRTRIDAHVKAKTLQVIFYVETSRAVTLLRSELAAFRQTLHALGYEDVVLAAKPLRQLLPEQRQQFDSLAVGVPKTVSLVDVRA